MHMDTKKSDNNDQTAKLDLPVGVVWEDVIRLLQEKNNQEVLKKIDPETFRFLLDKNNHSKVIDSLLKTLKDIDPENATVNYANKLIEIMKLVASEQK